MCIVVVSSLQHKRVFSHVEMERETGWMFEAATMALQVFVTFGNLVPTHFIWLIVSGEKYSP